MRKLTFLFALLCASMMSFAIDWSGYDWIGDGAGGGAYSNKYKLAPDGDQGVVNIQHPGFASADGIYTTFTGAVTACDLGAGNYDAQGGGLILHLDAFTAKETVVNVTTDAGGGKNYTFTVYYEDGTEGGGGGSTPDPDPTPEPTPGTIDWSTFAYIGDGAGGGAYSNKYKLAPDGDQGVVNIQHPGFASADGIYTTFTGAVTACDLGAGNYDAQGGGLILHLDAFTAKETVVNVTTDAGGGKNYTFTVYYEDGTEGGSDPEPTEIYDVNFALVSLEASATSDNGGTANNAIDNNDGTSWESTHGIDAVKLTIDLGQKRIFNTVQIRWEGAYGKAFTIDVSNDGSDWTTVKSVNETLPGPFPYEQTLEFAKTTARYIRFNGIERGLPYGYNMFSFRVLLPGVSVLTSIDLTAPAKIAEVGGAGVALAVQPKDQNGQNMASELSWEITPAAAGHMSGNTYIPDQAGNATIRAYSGEVYSPAVSIIGVASANLALSTNIATDNKIVAQSAVDPNGSQYDAFYAVDGNLGSVWQGRPDGISGGDDAARTFDSWFVVDLGAFYNIDLVALHFEGACSELYHIDFSANNTDWNLGYNLVGAGGINARNDYWTELDNNTKVRYVRFWSTKAATEWGMKLFEFEVYGTEWISGDEEKPSMVSASLVSSTANSAVIAVSATDNDEVARFHVVDGVNGIDANFTPSDGKITITGLTHATNYNFTITAKDASNNESENSMVVAVSTPFDGSINLALNQPCEGGYYDNNPAESDDKANDGLENTQWTTYGAHAIELDWWIVDLGQIFNLTNISVLWGDQYSTNYILQARVEAPSAADKADDAAWVTLATVADAVANAEKSTNVSGVGRYVRFRALARTDFLRLKEFRVFGSGIAEVDTEKPVMTSASLVSNTDSHAVIAVSASDNQGIASFRVVDAGNSFDANFAAEGGNITVTGLAGGTSYNFTITAIDFFGNESENSESVEVTTTAHYTEPQAACPAPEWPADQVDALYSPTYSADYTHQDWGSGTVATIDEFGHKYVVPASGYFGADGFSYNCINMEKLHYDIWIADDATLSIVPICRNTSDTGNEPEIGVTVNLIGQQWNSIDLTLATDYSAVTNWSNVYQIKIANAANLTFWVGNAYFYRTTALEDDEAPTNVTASVVSQSYYSLVLEVSATDNMGALNYIVKNGETQVATGSGTSGASINIPVSNLTPSTNYLFNVIAKDGNNNEAAPVAVATSTLALPSAAPTPNVTDKNVVPVFSDAIAGAPNINLPWWEQATVAQFIDLTNSDKLFYCRNFNYQGWDGFNIDATGMEYLHVDVFTSAMTSIGITPISPEHELPTAQTLTAGEWTSLDIPLSVYASAEIDWTNVFQFKFDGGDGGEFFIDNVYFWAPIPEPEWVEVRTGLDIDRHYTVCLEKNITDIDGATFWSLDKRNAAGTLAYLEEELAPEAGKPYIIQATKATLKVVYGNENADDPVANGALRGTFVYMNKDALAAAGTSVYMLFNNELRPIGDNNHLDAHRAYVLYDQLQAVSTDPVPAPGRRVKAMPMQKDAATGIDELNASEAPVKMIIDGQFLILRGEKLYDATGRLVK